MHVYWAKMLRERKMRSIMVLECDCGL